MKIIWSKAKSHDPICFVLEEPVSHMALCFFDSIVFHSTFWGVDILSRQDFEANREIVFTMTLPIKDIEEQNLMVYLAATQTHKHYDWPFFFWLCKVALLHKLIRRPMPEKIQVQSRGQILCTEIIELLPDGILPSYDKSRAVTPFRLFKLLESQRWQFFPT